MNNDNLFLQLEKNYRDEQAERQRVSDIRRRMPHGFTLKRNKIGYELVRYTPMGRENDEYDVTITSTTFFSLDKLEEQLDEYLLDEKREVTW